MHMIVNRLPIRPDADWDDMIRRFDAFEAAIRPDHPELLSMQVMRSGEAEAILVIGFTDAETLAAFSSQIAGPWFGENIRAFLDGPAERKTGPVVAGFPK